MRYGRRPQRTALARLCNVYFGTTTAANTIAALRTRPEIVCRKSNVQCLYSFLVSRTFVVMFEENKDFYYAFYVIYVLNFLTAFYVLHILFCVNSKKHVFAASNLNISFNL